MRREVSIQRALWTGVNLQTLDCTAGVVAGTRRKKAGRVARAVPWGEGLHLHCRTPVVGGDSLSSSERVEKTVKLEAEAAEALKPGQTLRIAELLQLRFVTSHTSPHYPSKPVPEVESLGELCSSTHGRSSVKFTQTLCTTGAGWKLWTRSVASGDVCYCFVLPPAFQSFRAFLRGTQSWVGLESGLEHRVLYE